MEKLSRNSVHESNQAVNMSNATVRYYKLNPPSPYFLINHLKSSASHDPNGRTTVLDLLEDLPERVYTVGRLDFMSEGLILVTNDGELTHTSCTPNTTSKKPIKFGSINPLAIFNNKKRSKESQQRRNTSSKIDQRRYPYTTGSHSYHCTRRRSEPTY